MYRFKKSDRLSSSQDIDHVFKKGRVFVDGKLLCYVKLGVADGFVLKSAVGVSKKNIHLAVHRNKVKRQLREIYRHHLPQLKDRGCGIDMEVLIFWIYKGKYMPIFSDIKQCMSVIVEKLIDHIGEYDKKDNNQ